jgi:hypothetical protein
MNAIPMIGRCMTYQILHETPGDKVIAWTADIWVQTENPAQRLTPLRMPLLMLKLEGWGTPLAPER